MQIRVRCPMCNKKYRVPAAHEKRAIKCTECGYPFFVIAQPSSAVDELEVVDPSPSPTKPATPPIHVMPPSGRVKAAERTQLAMPALSDPSIPAPAKPKNPPVPPKPGAPASKVKGFLTQIFSDKKKTK